MASEIDALLAKLDVQPTVHLPDMGERTVDVAASIRQLMVERAEAAASLRTLVARIRELEAALKPFAEAANDYDGMNDAGLPEYPCSVGDLRRAATAYKGEKG